MDASSQPSSQREGEAPPSPPSKILVLCVGVIFPGAGHFLGGMPRRAVVFALSGMALSIAVSLAAASAPSKITLALYLAPYLLHLASLVDLARTPREQLARVRAAAIGQVLALVLAVFSLRNGLRNHVVSFFAQPSGSMVPAVAVGDYFLVSKRPPAPAPGDIVVFESPEQPERILVKRLIGVGGDRIEQNGTSLSVNGRPIASCLLGEVRIEGKDTRFTLERLGGHLYTVAWDPYLNPEPSSWEVKPGEVFVVGDNRSNSHDSRVFRGQGAGVSLGAVLGRATYRIFRAGGLSFGPLDDVALPPGAESLAGRVSACRAELGGG